MKGTVRAAYARVRGFLSRNVMAAVLVALLVGVGMGSSDPSAANVQTYRDRLADARADLADMRASAEQDVSSLTAERDELASDNGQLSSQVEELEKKLARMNAKRRLPSLIGRAERHADALADRYGWRLSVDVRFSTARPGTIVSQSPAAGTMMRYGAPFGVVVAKAIPRVPNVTGTSKGAAAKEIRAAGWTVAFTEQVASAKPGTVVSTSPGPGARLMPGDTVTLVIAKKAPPPPPAPASPPSDSSADSSSSGAGCTPGYEPCLPPASDYDCASGTGDGPKYTGYVRVTGSDPYGLDDDGDGAGCENG
ncbi:MAG TPA: PASTA domain-containing protein [Actinomycetota bacterium]|nr:PASTA domain-containing protein [Actinomycetota bacterium]